MVLNRWNHIAVFDAGIAAFVVNALVSVGVAFVSQPSVKEQQQVQERFFHPLRFRKRALRKGVTPPKSYSGYDLGFKHDVPRERGSEISSIKGKSIHVEIVREVFDPHFAILSSGHINDVHDPLQV